MIEFYAVIAGVSIRFLCRSEACRALFGGYETEPVEFPSLTASVSDGELCDTKKSLPQLPDERIEMTALYRPLAEYIPSDGGFVFHGAAVSVDDGAYLFTAPSGTGKTTHIRLWRQYLGRKVDIVNGDKPIITAREGEKVTVHGTPWAGKERWQKNRSVRLKGICLLTRSKTNFITRENPADHLPFLFRQTFFSAEKNVMENTLTLLDRVLKEVPVYKLGCDISREAAKCSFEAMTGLDFEEFAVK